MVAAADAEDEGKSASRAGRRLAELPPGWSRVRYVTGNGNTRSVISDGQRKARTVQGAWLTYMSGEEACGMQADEDAPGRQAPAPDWPRTVPAAAKRPKMAADSIASGAVMGDLASVAMGMTEVREMLERFRLGMYAASFDEAGYDDRDFILQMSAEHLDALVCDVGMKPGHALKFRDFLAQERRRAPQAIPQSR
jgi:hypothetical protein